MGKIAVAKNFKRQTAKFQTTVLPRKTNWKFLTSDFFGVWNLIFGIFDS
jgi:hypothetical protein